jgi:hypothetical protein
MVVASLDPDKTDVFRSESNFETYHVQKGKSLQHHRLGLREEADRHQCSQSGCRFAKNFSMLPKAR